MIDTIIFDIGNVLVDFCWQKAIGNMKLDKQIEDRLVMATIKSSTWDEFDRGILTEEEIHQGFIDNDPAIEAEINDFWDNYYSQICRKYDYSDEWISSLKSHGYKIYFLSNFSEMGFRELAKELDFVEKADGAIISYREKLIKPDPEIYKRLLTRYNIVARNAVFIDDTPANIAAAEKFGINTILCKNKKQVDEELYNLGVK